MIRQPHLVETRPPGTTRQDEIDFSLVLGGPLYQLYLRTRLAQPPLRLLLRRIVGLSMICWLPLLALSILAGHTTAGVSVPFFRDPEVHIKFLVALPLLIAAEVTAHERVMRMVEQFRQRAIIAWQDQPRFDELIASAKRLRDSFEMEVGLLAFVLVVGYWMWSQNLMPMKSGLALSSWYAINDGTGLRLTAAGSYQALVSLSIFRFILIRWYFRLFIWYRLLWEIRGMPLHLNLYHPDRTAGLGFLSESLVAFVLVFVAQTTLVSGIIFTRILYAGQKLTDFKMEIAGALLLCIVLALLPLLFFSFHLERAGRIARREFGALASHYVDDFRKKWVQGPVRTEEPLLGTSDIQSLADLANSYNVVNDLRLLPVTKQTFIRLVILIALPLLPLPLTMVPLSEILARLFKMVF